MLCRNPYMQGMHARPCGQCMPCRFNRRRMWTHRIMLEAAQYKDNSFATLTYDDDNLPSDGSVHKRHLQLFMKSFRKAISPIKVRFYGVGEYGEKTQRPHYHLCLFGWDKCQRWTAERSSFERIGCTCFACSRVREAWLRGQIDLGSLSVESAQYVAGYVTKKMSNANDPLVQKALAGREPEFCLMSRRPGVGVGFVPNIVDTLSKFNLDTSESDVPVTLRHGSRKLPLGRHMRRKIREEMGRDPGAPEKTPSEIREEVRSLSSMFKASRKVTGAISLKEMNLNRGAAKVRKMETRQSIFKKEKKL